MAQLSLLCTYRKSLLKNTYTFTHSHSTQQRQKAKERYLAKKKRKEERRATKKKIMTIGEEHASTGLADHEELSDSSSSSGSSKDSFVEWSPPSVSVGDELEIVQYPDIHDNTHPRTLKVKVYGIEGPRIYYRVDPLLDTDRFVNGAVLLKKYEDEMKYSAVGLHLCRANEMGGRKVQWCHRGVLLTHAMQRMRENVNNEERHKKEASQVEEKVQSVNYRKMSMMAAKVDLEKLLRASNYGLEESRKSVNELGEMNNDRARDLLRNAEAGGIVSSKQQL